MAVAYVAAYGNNSDTTAVSSLTVDVNTDGPATAGNLLVCVHFSRFGTGPTKTADTNRWNRFHGTDWTSSHHSISCWWRIATGDSNDNWVGDETLAALPLSAVVYELSGTGSNYPIIAVSTSDHPKTFGDSSTSITSTAFSPPASPGMRLQVLAIQDQQDWCTGANGSGITPPSGATNIRYEHGTGATAHFVAIGSQSFSDSSSVSSTWSTSDVGTGTRIAAFDIFVGEDDYAPLPHAVMGWNAYVNADGQTSGTLTVSGATAGNLLIASCVRRLTSGGDTITASGYTPISAWDATTATWCGRWFYREATGDSNDNFNPSWTDGSEYDLIVQEFGNVNPTLITSNANSAEIDNASTTTASINTNSATPTAQVSAGIVLFAADTRLSWSGLTYGRSLDGDDDYVYSYNGQQGANDAYAKFGLKVLHDNATAESYTVIPSSTGTSGSRYAYAAIAIFSGSTQPASALTITTVNGNAVTGGAGNPEFGPMVYDGVQVVVALTGSDVAASGKKVYIEQDGVLYEQLVDSEDASSVTFTPDYGTFERGDAILHVRNPV